MIPGGITVNTGDSELVKSLKGHQKLAIAYPVFLSNLSRFDAANRKFVLGDV